MTAEILVNLVINAGFASAVAGYLVMERSKREVEDNKSKTELEGFIRNTLLKIIENNSGLLRENQIILSKCVDVINAIEAKDEDTASRG